jgi:hypothetical protein
MLDIIKWLFYICDMHINGSSIRCYLIELTLFFELMTYMMYDDNTNMSQSCDSVFYHNTNGKKTLNDRDLRNMNLEVINLILIIKT